jgi:hypothetical protein
MTSGPSSPYTRILPSSALACHSSGVESQLAESLQVAAVLGSRPPSWAITPFNRSLGSVPLVTKQPY